MIENAVYVNGKVVMRYHQPVPKLVQIGDTQYYFDCQHGMSLAFVAEEHVQPALNFEGGCCGGKKKVLSLATETQYKHWKDGNGGR